MPQDIDMDRTHELAHEIVVITSSDAAHVLHELSLGGRPGGTFVSGLIQLALIADEENQRRLSQVYPGLIAAVRIYKKWDDGIAVLQELERSAPEEV